LNATLNPGFSLTAANQGFNSTAGTAPRQELETVQEQTGERRATPAVKYLNNKAMGRSEFGPATAYQVVDQQQIPPPGTVPVDPAESDS